MSQSAPQNDVWDMICETPEEAAALREKGSLMILISKLLKKRGIENKFQLSAFAEISLAQAGYVINGNIGKVNIDVLSNLMHKFELNISISLVDNPEEGTHEKPV